MPVKVEDIMDVQTGGSGETTQIGGVPEKKPETPEVKTTEPPVKEQAQPENKKEVPQTPLIFTKKGEETWKEGNIKETINKDYAHKIYDYFKNNPKVNIPIDENTFTNKYLANPDGQMKVFLDLLNKTKDTPADFDIGAYYGSFVDKLYIKEKNDVPLEGEKEKGQGVTVRSIKPLAVTESENQQIQQKVEAIPKDQEPVLTESIDNPNYNIDYESALQEINSNQSDLSSTQVLLTRQAEQRMQNDVEYRKGFNKQQIEKDKNSPINPVSIIQNVRKIQKQKEKKIDALKREMAHSVDNNNWAKEKLLKGDYSNVYDTFGGESLNNEDAKKYLEETVKETDQEIADLENKISNIENPKLPEKPRVDVLEDLNKKSDRLQYEINVLNEELNKDEPIFKKDKESYRGDDAIEKIKSEINDKKHQLKNTIIDINVLKLGADEAEKKQIKLQYYADASILAGTWEHNKRKILDGDALKDYEYTESEITLAENRAKKRINSLNVFKNLKENPTNILTTEGFIEKKQEEEEELLRDFSEMSNNYMEELNLSYKEAVRKNWDKIKNQYNKEYVSTSEAIASKYNPIIEDAISKSEDALAIKERYQQQVNSAKTDEVKRCY